MIIRIASNRKTARFVALLVKIVAVTSWVFGGVLLLAYIMTGFEGFAGFSVGLLLFFFGVGFILMKVAQKMIREAEEENRYISVILDGNVRRLEDIANAVGKPWEEVKEDVQKLINKGELKKAYIDEGTGEIVLPEIKASLENHACEENDGNNNQRGDLEQEERKADSFKTAGARVVTCNCCGANNTITGEIGECEYCGSPIQ